MKLVPQILLCIALAWSASARVCAESTLGEELAEGPAKPETIFNSLNETRAPNPLGPIVKNESFPQPTSGLWGNRIAFEIGHGRFPTSSGWLWQRSDWFPGLHRHICQEDYNNPKLVGRWLIPYLRNAGATVYPDRCIDEQTEEVIIDFNSVADLKTTNTANWFQSNNSVSVGGKYLLRYNLGTPQDYFSVDIKTTVPVSGFYGVTLRYPGASQASTNAQFIVIDGAGYEHSYRVNQASNREGWVMLDRHYFEAGSNVTVMRISNKDAAPDSYLQLDAVRLGGGMGTENFGSGTSGLPRWQEAPVPWLKYSGYGSFMWQSSFGLSNDTSARYNHALFVQAELLIRLHSNGSTFHTGFGSEAYCHGRVAEELTSVTAIYPKVIQSIRKNYRANWTDRGIRETGTSGWPFSTILVELAFHDWLTDAEALMDADFRRVSMRGLYEGVVDCFTSQTGVYLPEPPDALCARNVGNGMLRVDWTTSTIGSLPNSYRVYYSKHPYCFKDYHEVSSATQFAQFSNLVPGEPYYFQIRSLNNGGASLPSETISACVSTAPINMSAIVINGFDRYDWDIDELDNTGNYIIEHTQAMYTAAKSLGLGLALDSANRDAVTSHGISLVNYDLVDWLSGHQEAPGEIFKVAEKAALRAARANSSSTLVVSGSRAASGLSLGDADDHDFLNQFLRVHPISTTTAPLSVHADLQGEFAGVVNTLSFSESVYDRLPSDVLTTDPATVFSYEDSGSAGVCRLDSNNKLVYFAFPLELSGTPAERAAIMRRIMTLEPYPANVKMWELYD